MMAITLNVNGRDYSYDGDPSVPLLWVLRDELGMTGSKFGCGVALCGACTIHLDGGAMRSCAMAASDAVGKKVVTIEGLDPHGDHPVQKAWREANVPQCGYCQAGQIMQAAALLKQNPHPSDNQIRDAMAGNLCRCGCYQRIVDAVRLASTGV
jgi:isoquinoline 1-oxidoreductase alpha subunit